MKDAGAPGADRVEPRPTQSDVRKLSILTTRFYHPLTPCSNKKKSTSTKCGLVEACAAAKKHFI